MKRNVGFIIPSLKNGGAERVLSTISLNIDQNINQYIFTWNRKEQDYDFNAEIVEVDIQNSDNIIKNIFVLIKRVIKMKKYKKKYNINTCISHLEGPNLVNLMSKGREKTIITVHNFQSKERTGIYGLIFKVLMKVYYNRADKVIAVSKVIKEDLINNFNINENKIDVIYNPFNCELIMSLSNEEIEEKYKAIFEKKVIINVGRLTQQKGQWHLLKAFSKLLEIRKDVNLVILGKGELEEKLIKLSEDLGIRDHVFFLGFQKNPFKFISKADLFALTSLYEGFPMCIAESMACGTAVVSVDCKSGPREMIDEVANISHEASDIELKKHGILVPKFSSDIPNFSSYIEEEEERYARYLNDILNNENKIREIEQNSGEHVYDFNVDKIIRSWNAIIQQ